MDGGEQLGAEGALLALQELGAQGPLLLVHSVVDPLQRAVGLQQGDGRFRAHAAHPRDVVGTVASEGLEVHHILRGNAQLLHHALAADLPGP